MHDRKTTYANAIPQSQLGNNVMARGANNVPNHTWISKIMRLKNARLKHVNPNIKIRANVSAKECMTKGPRAKILSSSNACAKTQRNYSDAAIWSCRSRLANNVNTRGANNTPSFKFDSKKARPKNRIPLDRITISKNLVANGTDISQQCSGQQIIPKEGAPKKYHAESANPILTNSRREVYCWYFATAVPGHKYQKGRALKISFPTLNSTFRNSCRKKYADIPQARHIHRLNAK